MAGLLEQVASQLRTVGPWSPRGRLGAQSVLAKVNALEAEFQKLGEAQLRKGFMALRFLATNGLGIVAELVRLPAIASTGDGNCPCIGLSQPVHGQGLDNGHESEYLTALLAITTFASAEYEVV